jgi:uncharacterized membrane protein YfcA
MLENLSLLNYLSILFVGAAAGFINILAGGGSFLTLPLLIFLGLPPNLANGTNRLAILLQNIFALGSFNKKQVNPGKLGFKAALFAAPGGVLGAWLATQVSNDQFRISLALMMIIMSLYILFTKNEESERPIQPDEYTASWTGPAIVYFFIGIYGGYVQAGVGFLILSVILWQNINLVHGNAIKILIIMVFTAISLAIFAANDQVDWGLGAALGLGNIVGAAVGTHITVKKGHSFIKRVVTIAVFAFAIKLLFDNGT